MLVIAIAGSGCTGVLGDPSSTASGDGDGDEANLDDLLGDTPGGVEISCDEDADLAPTPMLKLSTVQYENTVRDLIARLDSNEVLAEVQPLLASIPRDSLGDGFRSLDDRVALEHVQAYFDIGVAIGEGLGQSPTFAANFAPSCAVEFGDDCLDELSSNFLPLVFRRPVSEEELALLRAATENETNPARGIATIAGIALSSPRFVYHVEVDGTDVDGSDDLLLLDAYEVANRLSYTFWQTMPDEELFELAADGSLLDEDVYGAELERVFSDERSHATLEQFWTEWLKLEKFTGFETSRPAFQSLAAGLPIGEEGHDFYGDMVREVLDLTRLYTFDEGGSVADLLRSNVSVTQSEDLAGLYGIDAWSGSGAYPTFDPAERAGLLQRAALLVSNLEQTNPFHRGALVRRAILCDSLPQPDPNSLPPGSLDPPPFDPAQTTRDRFQAKVEDNGLCTNCHLAFSPIGYVMESYDALGRFRTEETIYDEQTGELLAQLPIDTSGDVRIASPDEGPVQSASELNERIAASGKVEACMAQNYLSFAIRRATESSSLDACVIEDLTEVLAREGGLEIAFERVARLPTFFSRKVGPR